MSAIAPGTLVDVVLNLTTKDNAKKQFRGVVYCHSAETDGKLVISMQDANDRVTMKIFPMSIIKELKTIKTGLPIPVLPPSPAGEPEDRVMTGITEMLRRKALLGEGVTPLGQAIMNAVARTYEAKWTGKSITVTAVGVIINDPYTPESCTGANAAAVNRVRKIVSSVIDKNREA